MMHTEGFYLSRVGSLKTWSCLPSRTLDATQTLNQITFTCTLNSTLNSRFLIKFLSAAASCDGSQQKHVCYWSPQLPNPITLLVIQKKELQKTHTRKHTHRHQRRVLTWCSGFRWIRHQSPAVVRKCCIIQTQTFFLLRDSIPFGGSLSLSTCSIPPLPKFHLGDVFLPLLPPSSHALYTAASSPSLNFMCRSLLI